MVGGHRRDSMFASMSSVSPHAVSLRTDTTFVDVTNLTGAACLLVKIIQNAFSTRACHIETKGTKGLKTDQRSACHGGRHPHIQATSDEVMNRTSFYEAMQKEPFHFKFQSFESSGHLSSELSQDGRSLTGDRCCR